MKKRHSILLASLLIFTISCNSSSNEQTFDSSKITRASEAEVEKVVEDFILVEDGGTIEIPAGFFELNTQLIIDNKTNITIKGAGMDKTFLSFKGLQTGGERASKS